MIDVACPCGMFARVPDARAGTTMDCPTCGKPVAVPAVGAASPLAARLEQLERRYRWLCVFVGVLVPAIVVILWSLSIELRRMRRDLTALYAERVDDREERRAEIARAVDAATPKPVPATLPRFIEAEGFAVKDAFGKTRATLGRVGLTDNIGVTLFDTQGRGRLKLSCDDEFGTALEFYGDKNSLNFKVGDSGTAAYMQGCPSRGRFWTFELDKLGAVFVPR